MMALTEPWQKAEIPGPTKAMAIPKPEVAAMLILKSKNPIIISGSETPNLNLNNDALLDYIIRMSKASTAPIIATSNTIQAFDEKEYKNVFPINAMEAASKLSDPKWKIGKKAGQHDTAVFIGFKYYMLWLILSNLKHYTSHLKTISLERYYQPHAGWSFPNLTVEKWIDSLKKLIQKMEA